jgi:hypothetical protein
MTPYEIPLTPQAQRFFIVIGGTQYQMTVRWCQPMGSWILDIAASDGTPIVGAIPLVPGTDLLGQYAYLQFGGELRVQSDSDLFRIPQYSELGISGHVYFIAP